MHILDFITYFGYEFDLLADLWNPLYHKKDIIITTKILNLIYYSENLKETTFQLDIKHPLFIVETLEKDLIKLLKDNDINYIMEKNNKSLFLKYRYLHDDTKGKKKYISLKIKDFKSLIMILSSKNKVIREYYIILEQILSDYNMFQKDNHITELYRKINYLENNIWYNKHLF